MKVNELFEASEDGDEGPTGRGKKAKKTPKKPEMPKMGYPGLKITMLQAWQDRLPKAIKALGFSIDGQGYTSGSTQWTVAIAVKKSFNKAKFEEDLRDALNFDGFLDIEWFDLAE